MANNTVLSQVDWTLLMIIVWFKEFILQIHINSYGYGYGWRWSWEEFIFVSELWAIIVYNSFEFKYFLFNFLGSFKSNNSVLLFCILHTLFELLHSHLVIKTI